MRVHRLWCWEGLGAGEEGDDRGWDGWMASREWTPGVGDGQGGLACCDSWGRKESDMTEQLNWTELKAPVITILSGECNLGSVSSQQRFEAMDVKALGASELLDSLCYSSWTDQFYLENKGKYTLESWRHADLKDSEMRERERERGRMSTCMQGRERERPPARWLLFLCFFLPLGLPYVNWASQECYFFCLRSSLWSLDLPLFYFCGLFPS